MSHSPHSHRSLRLRRAVCAALALLTMLPTYARADTALPVIVTYELAKQRDATRAVARDPRSFWIHQIVSRLEETKPVAPVGLKGGATVQVDFTVSRDGHVVAKSVKRSSGVTSVDDVALAMIDRAQPFPPMPDRVADKDMSFTLPLRFR